MRSATPRMLARWMQVSRTASFAQQAEGERRPLDGRSRAKTRWLAHALAVPELPDVTVYVERLAARCVGQTLERVRVTGPSLLRSVDPPLSAAEGRRVLGVRRLGKRIVFELEGDLFLIFHLMIAGRFHWRERGARPNRKI